MEQIAWFTQVGAQLNILKNCDSSLRCASSGMRRWAFCDLTRRQHVPPTGGGVLARPSFFREGRSFKLCAAHLGKACMLLGVSAARKSRAVIAAGRGLAKAGGRSSAPPRPAISRDQLIRLVATNGRHNEKTMIDLISWTFLRRAPSESLPLCGRQSGEDMGSDGRLESKAVTRLSGGKGNTWQKKTHGEGLQIRPCVHLRRLRPRGSVASCAPGRLPGLPNMVGRQSARLGGRAPVPRMDGEESAHGASWIRGAPGMARGGPSGHALHQEGRGAGGLGSWGFVRSVP